LLKFANIELALVPPGVVLDFSYFTDGDDHL